MYKSIFVAAVLFNGIYMFGLTPGTSSSLSGNTTEFRDSVFHLKGQIKGQKTGYIKLYYTDKNSKRIKDSAAITNGKFQLSGQIKEPTMAYLEGDVKSGAMDEANTTSFYLEPATITIQLTYNDFKKAVIKGSATQDESKALSQLTAPVIKEMEPISKEYDIANAAYSAAVKAKKDEATLEALKEKASAIRDKFDPFSARMAELQYQFFRQHPQSYVTAFNLRFYVSSLPLDSLKAFYTRLGPLQQSSSGKELAKEIEQMQWGSPGSVAKNFTSAEINGGQLSLSDYKGKYVLLDFWASWCIPCRKGNPHLKELYARYKDNGIEFIGIADDDREENKWREAVAKDGIGIWKHIRRGLKYENGSFDRSTDISDKFGIHTLPTKILIDRDGVIIGRYSEEEAPLDEMLKKLFGH